MVLDTSVLIALLTDEVSAPAIEQKLSAAKQRLVSAAVLLEANIVYLRKVENADLQAIRDLLSDIDAVVVPVTREQAEFASMAYAQFGKGRHPARLNFGDCFSYALAKSLDQPLLFTGDDFSQTDVTIA